MKSGRLGLFSGGNLSYQWEEMTNASLITSLRAASWADRPGRVFLQYAYLQMLDIMTTVAFLLAGVQEANPLVRSMIEWTGHPLAALASVKLAALMLGMICWRLGKIRLLQRANAFFAVLVAWNLFCLILGLGHPTRP